MSSSKLTLSKASLVGAKRVKGPAEARVSTRPAAFTAANKVENLKNPEYQENISRSWMLCWG